MARHGSGRALLSGHHPHDARDSGSTHAVQQIEALPALQVIFDLQPMSSTGRQKQGQGLTNSEGAAAGGESFLVRWRRCVSRSLDPILELDL